MEKAQHTLAMEQALENYDFGLKDANGKMSDSVHANAKLNKCNQCDYASSQAGHLRLHLKTHSEEKLNKCDQCSFTSSQPIHLRSHLKTHIAEIPSKQKLCDFASIVQDWTSALEMHLMNM